MLHRQILYNQELSQYLSSVEEVQLVGGVGDPRKSRLLPPVTCRRHPLPVRLVDDTFAYYNIKLNRRCESMIGKDC